MRTLLLTVSLLFGLAYGQTTVIYGGNYTTTTGEQRSVNIMPAENGQFYLIEARADGMDQSQVSVTLPVGSETVTAVLPTGEVTIKVSGDTYEVEVDPELPAILLIRQELD